MRRAVRPWGLLAVVASLLGAGPRPAALQNDALSRYARGEFDVVESLTVEKCDAVRREVKSSALSPQIKAAFLLEAYESFQRRLQLDSELKDPAPGNAFADAYAAVERMPATLAFASAWYGAASAAMAHGPVGQSQVEWIWRFGGGVPNGKINKFESRFLPEEVALNHALPLERLAWRVLHQDRRTYIAAEQRELREFFEKRGFPLSEGLEANALPHALAALAPAQTIDAARPEALMRHAALLAVSNRAEEALPLFDESLRLTRDTWVAYLDHLLKGRALETLERDADAEASYRAAVALNPKARSANLALAAVSFGRGVRADANLTAALDPEADRLDPWAQFIDGNYRFWPERREVMRRTMR
jgi:tetratricopeptide (TPR) repeat protein